MIAAYSQCRALAYSRFISHLYPYLCAVGAALSAEDVRRSFPQLEAVISGTPQAEKRLLYGTAGFRDKAGLLKATFVRMGLLAALRSRKTGRSVGLVATASHNAAPDNGIKLVDPDGGMLDQRWEGYAQELADVPAKDFAEAVAGIANREGKWICQDGGNGFMGCCPPKRLQIFIAQDTRNSGMELLRLAASGAACVPGVRVVNCGTCSTPLLHHWVRMANLQAAGDTEAASFAGYDGYICMLATAYARLSASAGPAAAIAAANGNANGNGGNGGGRKNGRSGSNGGGSSGGGSKEDLPLIVDAACGVGKNVVARLMATGGEYLASEGTALKIELRNAPGTGELNDGCGAEHVQKLRKPPRGLNKGEDNGRRACSLDGDADRIVFHYYDQKGIWHLLDGDKIAVLISTFLLEELQAAGLSGNANGGSGDTVEFVVVQTAYANGAATAHLRARRVPMVMAKTGVKFLHHEAVRHDLSVYFEANGHGTVLFGERCVRTLKRRLRELQNLRAQQQLPPERRPLTEGASYGSTTGGAAAAPGDALGRALVAVRRLLDTRQLVNQAVGDAVSDMLLVQVILRIKGWSFAQWDGLYADLPSRQAKLAVVDRTVVVCDKTETRLLQPQALQVALDGAISRFSDRQGRCFVRPSGTEDVVRVYAEAATQEAADELALAALRLVHREAGGVGPPPKKIKDA